ncbi:MAG TPA: Na(+)/H(+) antiporter subunit C [Acidimicrobiia bacterium]|nr:NADH-quinone oxidoreductase subunit K [Acidimicrobiales bacterium]HIM65483.1 Na(+)/H(+) antiporter subunit C [Acidimicrobiia bacterium]
MTTVLAICVTVIVTVSVYLMLSRELKSIAMGVFLLGHGANLSIIAMSGSPVLPGGGLRQPPILGDGILVDALPQALILTAIVINFAVMGFFLTLLVLTARNTGTLNLDELALEDPPVASPELEPTVDGGPGGGVGR